MRVEEWLVILEQRLRVQVSMVAKGLTYPKRQALIQEINKTIALEIGDQDLTEQEMMAEAEQLLLSELLARGLSLPAAALARSRYPRHVGGLNDEEAVCLWLGAFRQQTFGLAGLWQIYLDLEDLAVPLPDIIREVFDPQAEEGENQDYIDRILGESRQAGLALTDRDTSKVIAWALETDPRLRGRDPVVVAQELCGRKSRAVNAVDQNLLRAGNTLLDEFVRRVYGVIDNCC